MRVIRSSLADWRSMKKECRHAQHIDDLTRFIQPWTIEGLNIERLVFFLAPTKSRPWWLGGEGVKTTENNIRRAQFRILSDAYMIRVNFCVYGFGKLCSLVALFVSKATVNI
jgi:hypothetical protein